MHIHAATAEMSALVQQLLLSKGARYDSVLDESNWKSTPARLIVEATTDDPRWHGDWLILPWDVGSSTACEHWLDQYRSRGGRLPSKVILLTSLGRVDPNWVADLQPEFETQFAAVEIASLSISGPTELCEMLEAIFDEDLIEKLEHINPLTRISGVGDSRDPAVFVERLKRDTPRVVMTKTLISVNVTIYVLMLVSTGFDLFGGFDVQTLRSWGANVFELTEGQGQLWRLMSCTFLHANVIHIGMNMWALNALGQMVERLFGSRVFIILYLLSGLGGSICSVMFTLQGAPWIPSVGASGAVFGVMGALLGYALARRGTMPASLYRSLTRSAVIFIGLNLAIGLSIEAIDNAAHGGGLLTGLVTGAALSRELPPAPQRSLQNTALRIGLIVALQVGAWLAL